MFYCQELNVSKYEFLAGKDILPEKYLQEKAAAIKIFEYYPLGNELLEWSEYNLFFVVLHQMNLRFEVSI